MNWNYNDLCNWTDENDIPNVITLNISNNKIKILPLKIFKLINLQELNCYNNKLTNLPNEIGQLINLQIFYYSNNLINYIPPNINRILNRIKNHQNIYNDSQNIHNNDIQKCIIKSINNIIQIKPTIIIEDYLIQNNILTEQTKQLLFEYINNNEVHSILNITFKELL